MKKHKIVRYRLIGAVNLYGICMCLAGTFFALKLELLTYIAFAMALLSILLIAPDDEDIEKYWGKE